MADDGQLPELTDVEREVYSWQMTVAGFGEEGQQRLKAATVMVSRVGGLGGLVAYELAAAGVGRLVLAHGGTLKPSDLNRQLLMRHNALGQARIGGESAATFRVLYLSLCYRDKGLFDAIDAVAEINPRLQAKRSVARVQLDVAGKFYLADEEAAFTGRLD